MKHIHIIIVIYNISLNESKSYKTCLKISQKNNITIWLMDNSDIPNGDPCIQNIKYIPMNGNQGLSKAYNKAISMVPYNSNNIVILLDQDTSINEEYFEKVLEVYNENKNVLLLAPYVYDKNGLLSPCKIFINKAWRIKLKPFKSFKRISLINSGLCIRADVFKKIKYNKNLFLDYIDHDFIKRYKNIFGYETISFINIRFYQEFSGSIQEPLNKKYKRYKIYIKDYIEYSKTRKIYLLIAYFIIILRAFKLSLQYKTFKFILAILGK
jgi:rhamnosyltransferase